MKITTPMITTLKQKVGIAPIALGAFAFTMFVLYMWQLSMATSAGYAMRATEREITELGREIAAQQVRISNLSSVDSVSGRIQLLGLTKATEVRHVFTASTNVAVR